MGRIRERTRTEVRGSKSSLRVHGGAIAFTLEMMSCHSSYPDYAPVSTYRSGKPVRVVRYGRAINI